ncbi:hypothetical protein VXN63_02505 [Marinilactibacillus sp. XAAS-LB27]|uniref:hypothetical protein n=1 Tax=Marinilactibacillus sp. XAAS-LB27 TaxID=3114538 RepID=UPI002E189371|nr:hypothetical protein [Marinilactibacillus sp. XAAS-LB27]
MIYKKSMIALLSLVVILIGGVLFINNQTRNRILVENDSNKIVPIIHFYLSPSISDDPEPEKDFKFGSTSEIQSGETGETISSQEIVRDYNILLEYELRDGTLKSEMVNDYIGAHSKGYSDTLIITEVTEDGEMIFKNHFNP